MATKLTPKKKLFCELYYDSWNATQAYKEAFKKTNPRTCQVSGYRLLLDAEVQKHLVEISESRRVAHQIAKQKLEEYLWKVLNADLSDGISQRDENGKIIKLPDKQTMKFVTKITGGKNPKIEMFSKEKAAELLARMTGAIKPDILMQANNPNPTSSPVTIEIPSNGREK